MKGCGGLAQKHRSALVLTRVNQTSQFSKSCPIGKRWLFIQGTAALFLNPPKMAEH